MVPASCPSTPALFSLPTQAEVSRAELELAINKLKAEEASLRDSLSKMSSLNEGLAQDKTELNRILIQVGRRGGHNSPGPETSLGW